MPNTPLAPFSSSYTNGFPELLKKLNCSLAISTYQAGKVVFISPKDHRSLVQLPRTFPKAMGIGLDGNKMVIATEDEVMILANSPQLAAFYPNKPNTYDALYMPRTTYHTGALDVHDIDLHEQRILAVNTAFSCLVEINSEHSFTPIWQPFFIDKITSEDRCHLNGMAVKDGQPTHVTAFAQSNSPKGWRPEITTGGILMDVARNEVVVSGLAMPHSPRWFDDALYLLLSATGELVRVDLENGTTESIFQIQGFVRGMAKLGDYVFIGVSKFRESSTTFKKLDAARAAQFPGIIAIHLPSRKLVGELRYHNSVEEIYDVQVLPQQIRPGILNTSRPEYKSGLTTPSATYWGKIR